VGVRLPDGTDFSPILVEGYQVLYSKEGAGDEWRALTDLRLQRGCGFKGGGSLSTRRE
jgi:hypothetical protein